MAKTTAQAWTAEQRAAVAGEHHVGWAGTDLRPGWLAEQAWVLLGRPESVQHAAGYDLWLYPDGIALLVVGGQVGVIFQDDRAADAWLVRTPGQTWLYQFDSAAALFREGLRKGRRAPATCPCGRACAAETT